jgi:hypothetical protein
MFSKRALAVAVGATVASVAAVADVTVGTVTKFSAESILDSAAKTSNKTVQLPVVGYGTSLSGAIFTGREVLQVSTSVAMKEQAGTAYGASIPSTLGISFTGGGSNNATFSFIGLSADGKTLSYIRDNTTTPSGAAPGTLALTGDSQDFRPFFLASGFTGADVTVDILTGLGGATLESDSGNAMTVLGSQLASGSLNFGKTIDVEAVKKKFAPAGGGASVDNTTLDLSIDTSALATVNTEASISSVAFTITGDNFSWLDAVTTDVDTVALDIGSTYLAVAGTRNALSRLTATTIEGSLDFGSGFLGTLTLTNKGALEIPTQSGFDVAFTAFTENGAQIAVPGTVTGSWVLNGSSIDIYAVPNSASASVFMWLTNTGTGSVPVDVTLFDGAQTCEMTSVGTSVAGTEFDLTAAIGAAIPTQCPTYVASGNRVRYNVTASAPASTIRISAAYRVGTDRVNLLTSSETEFGL